ncbi:MAG: rod shape-determining protein MreC, partial [Hyphomonadaceae bacterium]
IAVNENGLVGRVVSVGQRSSRVLLLDDYNSRIPVIGAHSRVRAVMVGQAAEPPDLITRPFALGAPRLDYAQVGLREGEPIITSGDGGLYPRGIRVGAVRQTREGLFEVALAASHDPIDFVRLIPYERPDAPERSGVVEGEGPPLNVASGIIRAGEAAARPAPPPVETAPPAAPRRQGAVNRWFGNQTPPAQQQPAQQPPAPAPAQEQEAPPAQ